MSNVVAARSQENMWKDNMLGGKACTCWSLTACVVVCVCVCGKKGFLL